MADHRNIALSVATELMAESLWTAATVMATAKNPKILVIVVLLVVRRGCVLTIVKEIVRGR
jgi:hypothetical protein